MSQLVMILIGSLVIILSTLFTTIVGNFFGVLVLFAAAFSDSNRIPNYNLVFLGGVIIACCTFFMQNIYSRIAIIVGLTLMVAGMFLIKDPEAVG